MCELCESKTRTHKQLDKGTYITLEAYCDPNDSKGRLCLVACESDETSGYYPKYCPECGRKLKNVKG